MLQTECDNSNRREYLTTMYTESLLLIAGVVVLLFWTLLGFVGIFPGLALGSLSPVSTAVGFAIAGLGFLEFGVVVLNVQLAWILPDDHADSGVAPFMCCYCLLGQSLMMFPPFIIVAIAVVPLVLISVACVGWYFQKFTSLKLSKLGRDEYQSPLSMKSLLWMPVYLLGLGLIPLMLLPFCVPNYFELANVNVRYFGIVVIGSSMGMIAVSFLPLVVCYAFLFLSQCNRSIQIVTTATALLILLLAIGVEAFASDFKSAVMPLIAIAMFMFVCGIWIGLNPWWKDGLQVVFAKPLTAGHTVQDVAFDDLEIDHALRRGVAEKHGRIQNHLNR